MVYGNRGAGKGSTTVKCIFKKVTTIRFSRLAWNRIIWVLLLSILIVTPIIMPNSVRAQDERVTVRLDGRALFRVSAIDNTSASDRARQIERRMNRLLENPTAISSPQIETSQDKQERVITNVGVPIVTLTTTDAQDNLTTVDTLAIQWSQAINVALKGQVNAASHLGGDL